MSEISINTLKTMLANLDDAKKYQSLRDVMETLPAPDLAAVFEDLPAEKLPVLFRLCPKDLAADVFTELTPETQQKLIDGLTDTELKAVVDELFVDDATDLVEEMPANVVKRILGQADPATRRMINELLKYPEDSAGGVMTTEFMELRPDMTVAQAMDAIRKNGFDKETINNCYVTDGSRKLIGVVSLRALVLVKDTAEPIRNLMDTNVVSVGTTTDQEDVSNLFEKYGFLAIPVVDAENRLVGIVTIDDAISILQDEPTSSLTANEVESLFRIMRELKALGVALVYISHKMDEIKVIADEVTIMRDGKYIGKWDVAEMTKEQIIAKMVGRELSNLYPPLENHPSDEVMMKVEDFTSIHPRSFRHCSFEIHKGEILGVAGLVGAQRTELMEGIFGLRAHTSGKVWIKGEEVTIKQPRDAIQKSVALLTEDRRATGIMGVLSVADNISIASLDALRKGPIMLDNKKILDLVATNKEKMAIKVPSPKTQIKSLSGGNQQKVLIARWLANNPDVLILDEPTRGIDVGAKYEIYCIIAELAKQGKSIIMISSEMSEIIGMSNRVMVMCDGRITGFIDGKDATQENIMALATQFETAPTAAANQ